MARLPYSQRLPGTYWDIRSEVRPFTPPSSRGIVIDMMPLTWFNEGELVDIHSREWQSNFAITKLGTSAAMAAPDDPTERDIQRSLLALMASGVLAGESYGPMLGKIFPQNTGGAKAIGTLSSEYTVEVPIDPNDPEAGTEEIDVTASVKFVAKKYGAAGNEISVNIVQQDEMFTIITFFRGQRMYVQSIAELSQLPLVLRDNMLVDIDETFGPDGEVPLGEIKLSGGDNGTIPPYNTRLQAFLDMASTKRWHTIALSMSSDDTGFSAAKVAFRSWLRQLNSDLQEERHGVVAGDFADANTGMDSDQIDVIFQELEMNNDYWLNRADAVRLFAGRSAGAAANASQTNDVVNGITAVRPDLTTRQRQDADDRGLFTIIENWDGRYRIMRDINSFVSVVPEKNIQWRDNRTKRGIHDTMTRWNIIFDTQHKGRTDNNQRGREKVLGDADNLFAMLETENVMTEHDISKLAIFPSETSPTAARIEARGIKYVTAIDLIDFDMTVTW